MYIKTNVQQKVISNKMHVKENCVVKCKKKKNVLKGKCTIKYERATKSILRQKEKWTDGRGCSENVQE